MTTCPIATAWLTQHPAPWTVQRVGTLTGPEYDVIDAAGKHVPGLRREERFARAYAAMANELARLTPEPEGR